MEMSQLYDEDLLENGFFQQFCDMCPSLFNTVVENNWLICIPKVGTFEGHQLTEVDCMSHVLIEVGPRLYKTASDKRVSISEKVIQLEEGFESTTKIQVLFSETFYTDKQKKYQVWCIDRPLSFELSASLSLSPQNVEFRILNVDDSIELLFTGSNCPLKRNIDKMISTHKCVLRVGFCSLRDLLDMMHSLFTKCVQACHKDNQLKRRMSLNKHISDNLHISVETYIHHKLYGDIFGYICTAVASKDAKLNKINRNLSQLHRNDFGMASDFSCNLPRARRELLSLASFSTPLAKMACIKRVILSLMRNPKNSQELEPLTADDLIPMLIFVIVRSSLPTWVAHFEYMTQFHFSKSSLDDYTFYMSTLEAALFYIQSGELTKHLSTGKTSISSAERGARHTEPSTLIKSAIPQIDRLFESIKNCDLESIKAFLDHAENFNEDSTTSTSRMCHPLCSCDKCEQEHDEEGTNPRSMVTVFSRDDKGFTAMHQAAFCGQAEVVEYLSQHGGVVNATDYHSSTPLHIASQRGHQSAVMMLIDHGADVNSADNDGNRPLHMATLNGHEDCVKALLYQSGPKLLDINAANDNGDTALHQAAKWSYESITQLLLEQGAWPEARNRRNATSMMLVSDGTIAQLLTEAIEKAQERANDGFIEVIVPQSPLQPPSLSSDIHISRQENLKPVENPPIKVSHNVQKFLKAVSLGDINMVRHVMGWVDEYDSSESSDVDTADAALCHPLCQCKKCAPAQKSRASLVDINVGDEQGRTALHIATEKSNVDIVSLLLEKHADVNCKTNIVQLTPLHVACQLLAPCKRMVALLLDNDAKVNCKDCNGRTALHFASQTGCMPITRRLLDYHANANAMNIRGNTPLHEAAKVNNTDIVQLLLDYGANPTLANKNGVTAMQITSDPKIIQLVTEAMGRWREAQTVGASPRKSSVRQSGSQDCKAEHHSVSLKKHMFAALEADDVERLNQLTSSINRFNRQALKHTVTRDRSAPLLDLGAIAAAREAVFGDSTARHRQKQNCENATSDAGSLHKSPLDNESVRELSEDSNDPYHCTEKQESFSDDEQPECDLHISQENVKSCSQTSTSDAMFNHDNHCEHSGTESAGEHEH